MRIGWIDRLALGNRHAKFFASGDVELRLLDILTTPGALSIDVGANSGVYTYGLARHTPVLAIEPIPELAARLAGMGLKGVDTVHCALSDHEGVATLRIPFHTKRSKRFDRPAANIRGEPGPPAREVQVPLRRLDGFDLPAVGFVKVDVEGVERQVLDGARALVARDRPVFVIELIEALSPGCIAWVTDYFAGFDCPGFFVTRDRRACLPMEAYDPALGVENFLFWPSQRSADLLGRIRSRLDGAA